MRTINRYIAGSFLGTFLIATAVITFVMSIGVIFKITDLLATGVSWRPVVRIFLCGMPGALAFAIPISALVATLLVFGRLSSDQEISAMRSCGLSQWQIAKWPLLIAGLLSILCMGLTSEVAPRTHFARRSALVQLSMESATDLLEEGRFIDTFKGLTIWVGSRDGDRISDIRICDRRDSDFRQQIKARTGVINVSTNGVDLIVELYDVKIDPFVKGGPGPGFCDRWSVTVPNALERSTYRPQRKDLTSAELIRGIRGIRDVLMSFPDAGDEGAKRLRMRLAVELNKRIALSLSCFAFVLIGIPLGIKSHRRESSIGIAISLALVFVFYLFIIVAESLASHYLMRPDLMIFLPVIIFGGLGYSLLRRNG